MLRQPGNVMLHKRDDFNMLRWAPIALQLGEDFSHPQHNQAPV
jgi:hypothetical protein